MSCPCACDFPYPHSPFPGGWFNSQGYFGKPIEPWRPIVPWKYSDWMGWHEQGDGKWFYGVNIEQGRVKVRLRGHGMDIIPWDCSGPSRPHAAVCVPT